jgi:hypothetical protein
MIGGFMTLKNQERSWAREHQRQWRDIRLKSFMEFVAAYRAMLAYISSPSAEITASPHPRREEQMIPYFDETGRQLREQMEATITQIRLIAQNLETATSAHEVVYDLRSLAAARATQSHDKVPNSLFTSALEEPAAVPDSCPSRG